MRIRARRVFGLTVFFGIFVAIAVAISVVTSYWWAGLAFVAVCALIAYAAICVFS